MKSLHLIGLLERAPALSVCAEDIERAYAALHACFTGGGKLLLCGNGGSAADADHWSGELLKGFAQKRPLAAGERRALSADLADKLQGGLPAIPLTSFPALGTAFANDVDPRLIYAQLVWGLGRAGDALVGLSTSGNAENVCAAMETAAARGLARIGLTGEGGGRLRELCEVCIRVPARETPRVQEYHLPIYHCLCLMLEDSFFGAAVSARQAR